MCFAAVPAAPSLAAQRSSTRPWALGLMLACTRSERWTCAVSLMAAEKYLIVCVVWSNTSVSTLGKNPTCARLRWVLLEVEVVFDFTLRKSPTCVILRWVSLEMFFIMTLEDVILRWVLLEAVFSFMLRKSPACEILRWVLLETLKLFDFTLRKSPMHMKFRWMSHEVIFNMTLGKKYYVSLFFLTHLASDQPLPFHYKIPCEGK